MHSVDFQTLFTHIGTIISFPSEEGLTYNQLARSQKVDAIKKIGYYEVRYSVPNLGPKFGFEVIQ